MTVLVYLKGVSSIKLDINECNGCRMCETVCPHAVISVDKTAVIKYIDRCMECGACQQNCEAGAISVNAGVGCAAAVITGILNKTAPDCGCGNDKNSAKCC